MKRIRPWTLAIALLALGGAGCRDQSPAPVADDSWNDVRLQLSTNQVYVGDVVEVELRVAHPAGSRVEWPPVGQGKQIVIKDYATDQSSATTSVARWSVLSYEIGQHNLWTGSLTLVTTDGTRMERPLPAGYFQVDSILPTEGDNFRPAKGLAHWPRPPMTRIFIMLLAVLVLALLIALAVRMWRVRQRKGLAPPPPMPPHEVALAALRDLEQRTVFEQADPEHFFVELSAIVRTYLEGRFALRAPEQTTEEFMRSAASSSVLRLEHQQLVEAFLVECDLVKFARHRPGADRMRLGLEAAYRLVRETLPVPSPSGGAP